MKSVLVNADGTIAHCDEIHTSFVQCDGRCYTIAGVARSDRERRGPSVYVEIARPDFVPARSMCMVVSPSGSEG